MTGDRSWIDAEEELIQVQRCREALGIPGEILKAWDPKAVGLHTKSTVVGLVERMPTFIRLAASKASERRTDQASWIVSTQWFRVIGEFRAALEGLREISERLGIEKDRVVKESFARLEVAARASMRSALRRGADWLLEVSTSTEPMTLESVQSTTVAQVGERFVTIMGTAGLIGVPQEFISRMIDRSKGEGR